MTRKRSSPMGLEIYLPVLLAFIMLPLLAQAAPLQDYTEIQQYTEGCYYNYNHYNEGDRIMTNEPCLNCTCHNKMLMCYLRVCPFTKPIGHDCIVEKREDQCCPIITCPEVPVDVAHSAPEPGTELSFPEKFGCSIDGKFYLEGAQVPSNPNKPCELCYCIKNRTSCLMQECTLHIDGCTPIYNRGSCCPVRYNCDHENDVLELEDHSTTTEAATTTTERPTTGFIIASTMSPSVSTDCVHNGELYADGARIAGETACENCYCMRGDIICAVQECQMPMLNSNGKSCHALPAAEGECCPSNYVCEDDSSTTQIIEATTLPYGGLDTEVKVTTTAPVKDLHSGIPEEDLQLQTHIDEEETATKMPPTDSKTEEEIEKEKEATEEESEATTIAAAADISDVTQAPSKADELPEISTASAEDEVKTEAPSAEVSETPVHEDKDQQVGEVKPSGTDEEQEEPITKLPINDVPEISTDAIASSEEDETETSATDKPEIVDTVTEIPTGDNVEPEVSVSTDSTEEEVSKPVVSDEYATSAPVSDEELASTKTPLTEEGEHKPEESHEDITEGPFTVEHTTGISEESSTKAPIAIGEQESEHITEAPEESAEKEQETSTKISSEETDELSTPTAPSTASAEEDKEPQTIVTEDDSTVTEIVPGKISPDDKEEGISTGKPEDEVKQDETEAEKEEHETVTEKDIHETTQSDDESKPLSVDELSTSMPAIETESESAAADMSTESEESEIATKAPTSEDKQQESVTSSPHIEDEEKDEETSDYVPTKVPTLDSSESTEDDVKGPAVVTEETIDEEGSGESKPVADDDQEIDRVTKIPEEEHAATPTAGEDKHELADELGSGDHTTEVSIGHEEASQPSIIVSSTEGVTSIPETQDKEGDHVTLDESVEDKLPESETPTTSTETSEESAESEEDTKLMDLTTAKPSVEHIDVTTIKAPTKLDITTSATEASEEVTEKEIDFSTIQPIGDKVETEEEQATGKPVTIGEELPTDEIADKIETEEAATQKPIEDASVQQTTAGPTVDAAIETEEEETKNKVIPEGDDHTEELSTGITDSPMLITGEETDKEHDAESTTFPSKLEDNAESTTIKPYGEPTLIEETPDMQLPSVIPGEGDCLVGQKTYHNNSIIPTSDECEIVCKCVSSIVSCERVQCEVPENIEKCVLDESSTNKCCPSYICATDSLPPKGTIDSIESTEQDEDEEIPYTTIAAPHKLPEHTTVVEETEEKSEITTVKPSVVSEDVSPAISIPEIEMPIASTEEPMSHVKHEDEDVESHVTKAPGEDIAEDKKDTYPEAEEHTTPSAVIEDIIVPQSMAPVQVTDQEQQHTVTDKLPTDIAEKETESGIPVGEQEPETEKETKPEISVGQQEPETELHEETTAASVESVTDSSSVSSIPSADEYQTVKPIEEEKEEEEEEATSGELIDHTGKPIAIEDLDAITPTSEEDSKPESETLVPSAPSESETTEHVPSDEKESQPEAESEIPTATSSTDEKTEEHTIVPSVSSEEDKLSEIPEDHTTSTEEEDKETFKESEIQTPAPSDLEKDTQTAEPLDSASEAHTLEPSSEVTSEHTVAPAVEKAEDTSEEIEISTSVPTKDAEKDEEQPSSTESLEDTSSVPTKVHDTDNEEDITRTTAIPSIDDTKDHSITSDHTVVPSLAEDESTTAITPVSEEGKEPSVVPEISSSSTTAPALDVDKDEHAITAASEESDEDLSATTASNISPVETEHVTDSIEYSTVVPETEDKIVENVTPLEGESLEHTVAPVIHDEDKESSEETIDESSATVAPVGEVDENKTEVQTPAPISTDHTIAPTPQESVEETEEQDISTETLDIATHKPNDFETKIDTSSQVPSTDDLPTPSQENIDEDVATATVIPAGEEEEVSKEDHTQASSTDKYEGEQTESTLVDEKQQPTSGSTTEESESVASVDNVTVPSEEEHKQQPTLAPATTESESVPSVDNIDVSSEEEEKDQDEKENITIPSILEDKKELEDAMSHTVAPSIQEEEDNVTKHPVAVDEHKPEEDTEHVTREPSIPSAITEETSTSAVPVEKEEADEQKPISSTEEYSTAHPSIEMESTHAPSKQPSLDLSEEASGESEESEEEIGTEPTKIQHIGEFVTERVDEATVKPIDTAISSEEEKEASGEEDEISSSTRKPYQPTIEDEQSVIKPDDVSTISTDKLPEEEITPAVTKAPEAVTDGDTTAQQPQEEIIPSVGDHDIEDVTTHVPTGQDSDVPSVTKAPLGEQDIEDTSAQQPEEEPESVTKTSPTAEDIDHVTAHDLESEEEVTVKLDTTEQPEIEGVSSEHPGAEDKEDITKAPTAAEGMEDIRDDEENISSVTKSPIPVEHTTAEQLEDENIVAVTKAPITAEEMDTVADKKPEDEEGEKEDMEYTTSSSAEAEEGDNVTSVTKAPVAADEIENVTAEEEEIVSPVAHSTAAPEEAIDVTAHVDEIPETIELTTVKSATAEDAGKIEEHDSEVVPESDIEIATAKPQASESTEETETKPSEEGEDEILAATKVPETSEETGTTAQLPTAQMADELPDVTTATEIEKESEESDKPTIPEEEEELVETSTPKLSETSEHIAETSTEITEPEETKGGSQEESTELPVVSHIPTESSIKDTESELESTESPVEIQKEPVEHDITTVPTKTAESEEDESTDAHISTDILPEEESHEDTTDLSAIGPVSTDKLPEHVTEAVSSDVDSEAVKETAAETTEVPFEGEKHPEIMDHVTYLPTKHVESEEVDEELPEQVTQLPIEGHITVDKLPEHVTESEEEESTELPKETHVSSDELPEHSTTLPTKITEPEEEDKEIHEESSELPTGGEASTSKLPELFEHVTELPVESHEPELAEHVTELPSDSIEADGDDEEKKTHDESSELPESPEQVTKLPVKDTKSETTESTDKLSEIPQEHVEGSEAEKEESPELPVDVSVSTDKLLEPVTELPTKEMETEEESHELPIEGQEIPTKDTKTEDEVTESPVESHVAHELDAHVTELPTKDIESEEDVHETSTELPVVVAHDVSTQGQGVEQSTETASKEEESHEETTSGETAEEISADDLLPTTTSHPLFPHLSTTLPTVPIDGRIDDTNLTFTAHSTESPVTPSTTSTTTSEPTTTSASQHYQPQPPIYGQPPQYGPTQYEDEYTDEDEGEVFGPGTCRYGGKLYVSAQQIPRDDPCDFCFCFRSDIICLQQSCPPPIAGCHEEPISGFCCPRYECPVSMATVLNITTSTTTTSTTLPPHFLHHSYGNNVQRNGCLINGRSYRVGEKIESTSGPCINCTCGGDGKMKCDPQACVPEPTMQQVMAVVAAGRKR